ncbi:MAG: PAS domain S-box protein [Chloroherpetonaceae bacterium]
MTWLTLKSDELQPEVEHVESFEEFEEALEEQSFDLILCEYALQKRKTACDVIAYLKSKSISIPVIVLSKITEEGVVEQVLKCGASDYVFKTHLQFLPAALKELLSQKPNKTLQAQALPSLPEDFLKNLAAVRAQLVRLQSPFIESPFLEEDKQVPMPIAQAELPKPILPDIPSHASSSLVIEDMQKKIDELNETVATLNANNFNLQNELEQTRTEVQALREESSKIAQLESQLEQARQMLNELSEALKLAQEQAQTTAEAYEEERQTTVRLKAELLEKTEREKQLIDELEKAQETEMQLRIELQDAIITGNQLQEAVSAASNQLAQFEAMFKQYDAALNQHMSQASAFSEQVESAKAELAQAEEEKQSLESKLTAAQEAAQSLAQRFTKELADLRAKLDEEIHRRQNIEQELSQANQTIQTLLAQPKADPEKEAKLEAEITKLEAELAEAQSTISQLRADWEQADREVERLEEDIKILESSFHEKSGRLLEAQKALKAKERALAEKSAILDAINLSVVMVSVSGEICYWNEAAAVFHGIPAGEALGKKSDEVMKYKYASSKERKMAMELLQSVGRWNGKIKYLTPDGEQKTAEAFISRLDDEVGNPLGIMTILTDTTKRETMESEHRQFKQIIEPMLNAAPVSLITFDDAGIITGIFGKSTEQQHLISSLSKGKSIYELYGKYPQLLAAFRRVLSGEPVTTSLTLAELQIDFHFSPIVSNGLVAGAVGVLVEVKLPVEQA